MGACAPASEGTRPLTDSKASDTPFHWGLEKQMTRVIREHGDVRALDL
jgi:hypothetical protein